MALLSDLDRQLLLIQRIGDIDPETGDWVSPLKVGSTGLVLQNVDRLWNLCLDKQSASASFGGDLFDRYFMRAGVELIVGRLEQMVTFSAVRGAIAVRLSDRLAARNAQLKRLADEIQIIEHKIAVASDPEIGMITRATPITPPQAGDTPTEFPLDANSSIYSGSPYWRSGWRTAGW